MTISHRRVLGFHCCPHVARYKGWIETQQLKLEFENTNGRVELRVVIPIRTQFFHYLPEDLRTLRVIFWIRLAHKFICPLKILSKLGKCCRRKDAQENQAKYSSSQKKTSFDQSDPVSSKFSHRYMLSRSIHYYVSSLYVKKSGNSDVGSKGTIKALGVLPP